MIYLPFFKMFEKQVLEQEQPTESQPKATKLSGQGVTA
ncbi:PTS system, cellobiose-specific IIC component [Vibrio mimicus SX-4]|nr:PTS system, cellobiose-specific IIC component [Vibrio mimicus SX-4]